MSDAIRRARTQASLRLPLKATMRVTRTRKRETATRKKRKRQPPSSLLRTMRSRRSLLMVKGLKILNQLNEYLTR